MPEPIVKTTEEGQEEGQQQQTQEGQTPQGQQQEKLFAGRFKTPEELEEHYKLSSSEGVRLANEVKRLQNELQQAKTPKEKEVVQDKIDDLSKYFDKETADVLTKYFDNKLDSRLSEIQQQTKSQTDFQQEVSNIWNETVKLYPEVSDPKGKLYQRANEILFERKLAEVGEGGVINLLTPFAYRIAVEAAVAELDRQAPETANNQVRKNQATSVQGRSSSPVQRGKLTYEQYNKLSDDEKDAYDQSFAKK